MDRSYFSLPHISFPLSLKALSVLFFFSIPFAMALAKTRQENPLLPHPPAISSWLLFRFSLSSAHSSEPRLQAQVPALTAECQCGEFSWLLGPGLLCIQCPRVHSLPSPSCASVMVSGPLSSCDQVPTYAPVSKTRPSPSVLWTFLLSQALPHALLKDCHLNLHMFYISLLSVSQLWSSHQLFQDTYLFRMII